MNNSVFGWRYLFSFIFLYQEAQKTEAIKAIDNVAAKFGVNVVYFGGNNMEVKRKDGHVASIRGAHNGNTIYVRVDHSTLEPSQIFDHELFHHIAPAGSDAYVSAARALLNNHSEESVKTVIGEYINAYHYGNEIDTDYILEEILADSYAGIDVFKNRPAAENITGVTDQDTQTGVKNAVEDGVKQLNKAESGSNYLSEESNGAADKSRKFDYEYLVSKPDMAVTDISKNHVPDKSKAGRDRVVQDGINNGIAVGRSDGDNHALVRVKDNGKEVMISRASLIHGLDRRFSSVAPVTESIGEILQNSVEINEMNPKKQTADSSYVLLGVAADDKNVYIVRSVVNTFSNELKSVDVLYAVNAKKDPGAFLPRSANKSLPITGSRISISQLLDIANENFPDVLPESVLRHFGYTERPAGDLGESVLYSGETEDGAKSLYNPDAEQKLSTKLDKEYMEAISSGNETEARDMLDQAAEEAGYTIGAFHGTRNAGFTVFDRGPFYKPEEKKSAANWFSDSKKLSEDIYASDLEDGTPEESRKVYEVKLKIDNPLVINANGDAWNDIIVSDELSKSVNKVVDDYIDGKWIKKLKKGLTTEDIAKYAEQAGYDGVIFNNLVDGSIDQKPSAVYAVFDPEQIKSADIEVRDDSGNVISLSERFKDEADKYLEKIKPTLLDRQRGVETQKVREVAQEHPVLASAVTVPAKLKETAAYPLQVLDYAIDGENAQGASAGYNRAANLNTAVRDQVSGMVEKKWGKKGSFLYQTGMSMADFLFNTAITGGFGSAGDAATKKVASDLALAIMGTEAAEEATISAKDRGLTNEQAFKLGSIAGIAEIATEKVSVEALINKIPMGKSALTYILKNTVSEGAEEVGADVINLVADILISKDHSEWNLAVEGYKKKGMSDEKAFMAAFKDQAASMGLDFLGGALSGGIMFASGAAINEASHLTGSLAQAKETAQTGDYQSLIDEGLSYAPNTEAYKAAQKLQQILQSEEKLTKGQMVSQSQKNQNANNAELQEGLEQLEDLQKKVSKGQTITDQELNRITGNTALRETLGIDASIPFEQQKEQMQGIINDAKNDNLSHLEALKSLAFGHDEQAGENTGFVDTLKTKIDGIKQRFQSKGEIENGGEQSISDSNERNGSLDSGEQAGRVAETAGGTESREGTGEQRVRYFSDLGKTAERSSAREIGVKSGTEQKNIWVLQENQKTEAIKAVDNVAARFGVNVVYFGGNNMEVKRKDGHMASIRGAHNGNIIGVTDQDTKQTVSDALEETVKPLAAPKTTEEMYSIERLEDGTPYVDVNVEQDKFDGLSKKEQIELAKK